MTVVGVSAFLIMLIAIFLVLYPRYEDGVLGRLALAALAIAGLVIQMAEISGQQRYDYSPLEFKIMMVAMVVFLARHLVRVLWFTRCEMEWKGGRMRPLIRSAK